MSELPEFVKPLKPWPKPTNKKKVKKKTIYQLKKEQLAGDWKWQSPNEEN